jgi:parvulin-like peptidyl-prolyl isomerase
MAKKPKIFKGRGERRFLKPRVKTKEVTSPTEGSVPRITDETITEHREEVLSGARKFIYPLQHSKYKIVKLTMVLLVLVIIGFTAFTAVELYKLQSTSSFMYQVTKILPLPVARVGGRFVSYENYLFELRHYIHYFETQQEVDFKSEQGKAQLKEQRKKSLENVVNLAYVKKIAREKGLSVSEKEIDDQIAMLRSQNKLGSDSKVFEDVLKDYWGWSVADFRRSVSQELLTNKVLRALDTKTKIRADKALAEIKSGKDFGDIAKTYSDDPATKARGGDLGFLITKNDRNIPPQTIDTVYKLKPGEVSGVYDIGYSLEIVKNLGFDGDKVKAARIFFGYDDINKYLNDYKEKQKAVTYIRVN